MCTAVPILLEDEAPHPIFLTWGEASLLTVEHETVGLGGAGICCDSGPNAVLGLEPKSQLLLGPCPPLLSHVLSLLPLFCTPYLCFRLAGSVFTAVWSAEHVLQPSSAAVVPGLPLLQG